MCLCVFVCGLCVVCVNVCVCVWVGGWVDVGVLVIALILFVVCVDMGVRVIALILFVNKHCCICTVMNGVELIAWVFLVYCFFPFWGVFSKFCSFMLLLVRFTISNHNYVTWQAVFIIHCLACYLVRCEFLLCGDGSTDSKQ